MSPIGVSWQEANLIPAHPVSQKLVLCIDDNPAIFSYEEALLSSLRIRSSPT